MSAAPASVDVEICGMPRQVLFVQGAGEAAHDAWDDKLVRSLEEELGDGYSVRYPRMPNEADPRYSAWKAALLDEFEHLEGGAVLVGHSVGGAILIHVLAEQPPKQALGAISLIAAPFIGEGGWRSDEMKARADFADRLPGGVSVFLYHGSNDETVSPAHLDLYAKVLRQAVVRLLPGRDHQLDNDLREVARDIRSVA
jgi:predicted alpha/beta hydrolase family esterase